MNEPFKRYSLLPTEARNPRTGDLDRLPLKRVLQKLNYEDSLIHRAVGKAIPAIEKAARLVSRVYLAGGSVYWPTRDKIYVFAQDGSRQVRQPIDLAPLGLTGGNLVLAEDVLLIAAANELVAFNPFGRQVTLAAPSH